MHDPKKCRLCRRGSNKYNHSFRIAVFRKEPTIWDRMKKWITDWYDRIWRLH